MKKLLFIAMLIAVLILIPQKAWASTRVSEPSAKLTSVIKVNVQALDIRIKALENVFQKYSSPLSGQAVYYIRYADAYDVDWRLLPSISGLESSWGIFLLPGSYNAYGWGGGYIYFASWEDGIRIITKALREKYMNRGATDVWSIGPIYAESKTWSIRVYRFMLEIEAEYRRLSTLAMALAT